MVPTQAFTGTETVSTTEHSLTTDTAGPDVETSDGKFVIVLDLSALAAGDVFELKVYEKVSSGGTQRLVDTISFAGVQSEPHFQSPEYVLMHGWDATLKRISGSDRAIEWSIRNVAVLGPNEITNAVIAADAIDTAQIREAALTGDRFGSPFISAASIDTDTITAAKIAADAITSAKIQDGTITAAKIAADAITAAKVAADVGTEIAAAVLAAVVEGSRTLKQTLTGLWAWTLTKASGFDTGTVVLRDAADTKNRATITTAGSGRTAVTIHDLD